MTSRRPIVLALAGPGLGLAGIVGYFIVVFRFAAWMPTVRNDAVPNWILVALGLLVSIVALSRATPARRRAPQLLLVVNLLLAGSFYGILYYVPAVPEAHGPAVGAPAPDFALADHTGATVRLADFRSEPFLLVFYRGHW